MKNYIDPHDVLFGHRKRPAPFWHILIAACFVGAVLGAFVALVLP
jgi:hypothetical protein